MYRRKQKPTQYARDYEDGQLVTTGDGKLYKVTGYNNNVYQLRDADGNYHYADIWSVEPYTPDEAAP